MNNDAPENQNYATDSLKNKITLLNTKIMPPKTKITLPKTKITLLTT